MQKEIRVENVKINVFGQIIEIEPFILKVDAIKVTLDGFDSLEKAYEEGAYIQEYVLDKFWDNVYIKGTPKFDRYVSRGYSQGDAAEILVSHSLREFWGLADNAEILTKDLQKDIDHYLWDSEIYGTLDISFEYEVRRETFGDSVIMKFAEEFEYGGWGNDAFEFGLDVDSIINRIFIKTHFQLSETETQVLRKSLESLDQSDVK